RSLVDHVRQVGTCEPWRLLSDAREVDIPRDRAFARVQRQDLGAGGDVGDLHHDRPVEAPGAQEGVVEDVWAVGRGHDHDAGLGRKSIHLDEHLIERLLALIVALAHAGAALAADGVELVDEDDRWSLTSRLAEKIPDSRRANAYQRLDEFR